LAGLALLGSIVLRVIISLGESRDCRYRRERYRYGNSAKVTF
jgi:hypothetical protein